MIICNGCNNQHQPADTAPYMRDAAGNHVLACRKCITTWIKEGILWGSIPFWARKEGLDAL